MGGFKSRFKDCIQQSRIPNFHENLFKKKLPKIDAAGLEDPTFRLDPDQFAVSLSENVRILFSTASAAGFEGRKVVDSITQLFGVTNI